MWILVVIILVVVAVFWQYLLAAIVLWALIALIRHSRAEANLRPRPPAIHHPPKRVRARPEPVRKAPAPVYLPRWNDARRSDADREHNQWQEAFDRAA